MSSTEAAITSTFPHARLTLLPADPTHLDFQQLKQELYANAMSQNSPNGGGQHGYLGLVLPPNEYIIISNGNVPYITPVAPPINPVIPPDATSVIINEANRQNRYHQKLYDKNNDMSKALVRLIVDAVEPVYLNRLKHKTFGYANVTPLKMITHLQEQFSEITDVDMAANVARMEKAWDITIPLEAIFTQLDEGQDFAKDNKEPISDKQLIRIAYTIIHNTMVFNQACEQWRNKDTDDKTWDNFKFFFRKKDKDRRSQLTTASAGYHGYQAANKISQTQQQQQPTWASDFMNSIIAINTAQTAKVAELTRQLATLSHSVGAPKPIPKPAPEAKGYCHTHGITYNASHNSATCTKPLSGHQPTATITNQMGGTTTVYTRSRKNDRTTP